MRVGWILFSAIITLSCVDAGLHERALLEWKKNEEVVENAVKGKRFDPDRYAASVLFLHDITDITIRSDGTSFGLLPNQYTSQDLALVKKWCKKNCRKLYWDEVSHSVRISGRR